MLLTSSLRGPSPPKRANGETKVNAYLPAHVGAKEVDEWTVSLTNGVRKSELAFRLTDQLAQRGWSIAEAARQMDFDAFQLSRYARGLVMPRRRALLRLAKALGVELVKLAPWEEGRNDDRVNLPLGSVRRGERGGDMMSRRTRSRVAARTLADEATLLRFRREAFGLDRSEMAAGIGLTLTDIVMIESGPGGGGADRSILHVAGTYRGLVRRRQGIPDRRSSCRREVQRCLTSGRPPSPSCPSTGRPLKTWP